MQCPGLWTIKISQQPVVSQVPNTDMGQWTGVLGLLQGRGPQSWGLSMPRSPEKDRANTPSRVDVSTTRAIPVQVQKGEKLAW